MRHTDTLKRLNSVIQNHHNDCCVCACAIHTGYVYSPFGAVTATLGNNPNVNPFRFSSEYLDRNLGLIYYNFRHYNPTDGRWLSRDPIGVLGGFNLYGFTLNEPIGQTDRLGLFSLWPFGPSITEYEKPSTCLSGAKREPIGNGLVVDKKIKNGKIQCEAKIQLYSYRTNVDNGRPRISNGCGSRYTDWFVPNFPPVDWDMTTVDFTPACDKHDWCYMTCGTTQDECDEKFRRNMYAQCETLPLSKVSWCKSMADLYTWSVKTFGGDSHEESQDEHCKWNFCEGCMIKEYSY